MFLFFITMTPSALYSLSLHDALPICEAVEHPFFHCALEHVQRPQARLAFHRLELDRRRERSEEHTSELQSPDHLVCRLLLEKKNETSLSLFALVRPEDAARVQLSPGH